MFDTLFDEYKQITRENLMPAYRAICQCEGVYEDEIEFLYKINDSKQIPMPTAMVALEVFNELEFISVSKGREYRVTVNREAQRRTLEESRYYINLLKCVNRNKV